MYIHTYIHTYILHSKIIMVSSEIKLIVPEKHNKNEAKNRM